MSGQSENRGFYFYNSIIPIFAGALIYILFRKDTYVSLFTAHFVSIPAFSTAGFPVWLKLFLRGYAADILWSYSLAFSLMWLFKDEGKQRGRSKTLIVCSFFICFMEWLQKTGLFHGTFDWWDICLEIVSVIYALSVIRKVEEKNEKRV